MKSPALGSCPHLLPKQREEEVGVDGKLDELSVEQRDVDLRVVVQPVILPGEGGRRRRGRMRRSRRR
jgi:hypothetical protein